MSLYELTLRGKSGNFFRYPIPNEMKQYTFVFVGCMAENSKSPVEKISLQNPLPLTRSESIPDDECK